jgi:hypothetical protein
MGVSGNNIYNDSAGTSLAASGWYIKTNQSTSHEWDGADWTEISDTCS